MKTIQRQRGGDHPLARFVNHDETYGRHVIRAFASGLKDVNTALDLGAGSGDDLSVIKSVHPNARLIGIDANDNHAPTLKRVADEVHLLDLERSRLPFPDNSLDLVIANQVLEHTKEVWWIFHEVTRCLNIGGHFIIGVPNIASLHNRALLMFGVQPTQHKVCSAHVRPFSKRDTLKFVNTVFADGYSLEEFAGSQFYPFPGMIARPLSRLFPTMAFSIFFLLKKTGTYTDQFLRYPVLAELETNFFLG